MFKKANTYKIVGLGAVMALSSCGPKDDPKPTDPNAEKITALRADSTAQAIEVRAAVEPAKTTPNDITTLFDANFAVEQNNLGITATTLPDSAKILANTVSALRSQYGDPIPKNNETLTALETASKDYIATIEELNALYAKTK